MTYADIKNRAMNKPGSYKPDIFWVDAKVVEKLRPLTK